MNRVSRSWRSFQNLSRAERRLVARAALLLPLAAAGLRILGVRRTGAVLLPRSGNGSGRQDVAAARVVARAVHGAARWSPIPVACLPRALVLCRLLGGLGLEAELRLGAGKPGGRFVAHAWVEHGGVALAEADPPRLRFQVFDTTSGLDQR